MQLVKKIAEGMCSHKTLYSILAICTGVFICRMTAYAAEKNLNVNEYPVEPYIERTLYYNYATSAQMKVSDIDEEGITMSVASEAIDISNVRFSWNRENKECVQAISEGEYEMILQFNEDGAIQLIITKDFDYCYRIEGFYYAEETGE